MAKFRSKSRGYLLQDEDGVWANFIDHEFETTDKKVIARLKGDPDVTIVDSRSEAPAIEADGDDK